MGAPLSTQNCKYKSDWLQSRQQIKPKNLDYNDILGRGDFSLIKVYKYQPLITLFLPEKPFYAALKLKLRI